MPETKYPTFQSSKDWNQSSSLSTIPDICGTQGGRCIVCNQHRRPELPSRSRYQTSFVGATSLLKGGSGFEESTVCSEEVEEMELLPLEKLDRSDPPLLCEEKTKLCKLIIFTHPNDDDDDGHSACNLLLTQQ